VARRRKRAYRREPHSGSSSEPKLQKRRRPKRTFQIPAMARG